MSSVRTDIPFTVNGGQRALSAALRSALRLMVKPMFHPAVPLGALRAGLRVSSAITLPARGVKYRSLDIEGLAAEQLTAGQNQQGSVILYLHGGAYCVGSPGTHRALTSHLALASGATLLVPDYRLAPEHPFPAAGDDALAAYLWLLDQGHLPEQVFLAGDSAGGGLALATAMRIRDEQLPAPAGMMLISPWVDLTHPRATSAAQPKEYMLSWPTLEHAAQLYVGDRRTHPYVSPLLGELANLPPIQIIVGSEEILLGDAENLATALARSGVVTSLNVYRKMWHVFPIHAGLLETADLAIQSMATFVTNPVARETVSPVAS